VACRRRYRWDRQDASSSEAELRALHRGQPVLIVSPKAHHSRPSEMSGPSEMNGVCLTGPPSARGGCRHGQLYRSAHGPGHDDRWDWPGRLLSRRFDGQLGRYPAVVTGITNCTEGPMHRAISELVVRALGAPPP